MDFARKCKKFGGTKIAKKIFRGRYAKQEIFFWPKLKVRCLIKPVQQAALSVYCSIIEKG
jgi:hypothetical protein